MSGRIAIVLLLLLSLGLHAQSFQWGKRGGSNDILSTLSSRQEEVYSIATDSNKNIYVLSAVGRSNLNIDGVPKTNFGDTTTLTDFALASFACDGTYRWSKIIGGPSRETICGVKTDSQDNVYVAGSFANCGDASLPARIDSDFIISQSPTDCSLNFLVKYNANGVLQWVRRPQPLVSTLNVFSFGFDLDSTGNSYWLLRIPQGVYADGAFTNTASGNSFFVFKYDAAGNFITAIPIDMQLSSGYNQSLKFIRNHNNGNFYITSEKANNTNTAVVGGQTMTHTVFMVCYNSLGQQLWLREDTGTQPGAIQLYNLQFDSDNNIYLGGRMVGPNFLNFLGLTVTQSIATTFVMKVDPTAQNLLWSTYYNQNGALQRGAIALNGDEVGLTTQCAGTNFTWGSQTLNASGTNQGTEVLLARFDRANGNCIALTKIPGDVPYDDAGTALAVDASGDYILGGGFGHQLTFVTNTLATSSPQSDFFVAKYSTSPCSLGQEEFYEEGLQLYPNPATDLVTITPTEKRTYQVYDLMGNAVLKGSLSHENHTIDVASLPSGCYLVVTVNGDGVTSQAKLVKQ